MTNDRSGKTSRQHEPANDKAQPSGAPAPDTATSGIPVVGLGGSAGAFDCFKAFFQAMPPDSGAAFVVIQHLAPAHASLLSELLAQHTQMKVVQAQDGAPVEPNCVYVIPPNEYLGIRDGSLYFSQPVQLGGIRMPIDFFFRSLAQDRQERAICVLFSGAGSDGTFGARAIRGAGGLVIAQDPQTAQYGDMPRSAIATKMVDYVLPLDQMPQAITEYLRQPYVRGGEPAAVLEAQEKPGGLNDILAIVLAQTGCDFRCYKKSTILRRIERRMGLHQISDMARYSKLLRQDANEVKQLHKDLLINVTAFFRDAEAFEELRTNAIAPIVHAKQADEPFRVWVAGCSSGEEAYSIIMLLMMEIAAANKMCPIQVFATDIDEEALEFARQGIYPESIVADVGTDRLSRFFVRKEQGYQVSESLRNSVVFARQNLITDPPFSKMDLITCRNLLIYLDGDTQTKLVPVFNFALNSGGYLFLGKSEGVGSQNDLFALVSKKGRLYRRIAPVRPILLNTPILPGKKLMIPTGSPAPKPPAVPYSDAIRQALLTHFAASVVLVDRKGQILQFHGHTSKYLNMPTAEPSFNLLDTAKEGLATRLRSALHTAIDEGRPVVMDQVPLTREPEAPCVRVTVTPLPRRGESEPLLAVVFEDVPRPLITAPQPLPGEGNETLIRQLEDELRATQQDLQASIEEFQSANEELRVSNEEVVSTNEELQSTNEELETSKEELQSVNEELSTVNSQLQDKVERLDAANSDMANLLTSTQIATLFLDGNLRIKFFTPAMTRVVKLIASDIGRPISDLSMNFIDFDLTADAQAVLRGGPVMARDLSRGDGSIYHVRVMPYLAQKDRVDGMVATFDDVTLLRRADERTRRLATVVTDSNDAVILFDLTGGIQAWNRGAQITYGWSEEEALRMNIRDIATADAAAETFDLIRRLLAGENVAPFETERLAKDGRVVDVWLTITAVLDESRKVVAIATTERDITERNRADESLHQTVDALRERSGQLRALASELALTEQRERQRLAQVLHDGLQQLLVGAKFHLGLLQDDHSDAGKVVHDISNILSDAIETSRSLTAELSPPILRAGGLVPALEWLARWMQDKQGLTVSIQAQGEVGAIAEDVTFVLFQATRELLFNVVKHAGVKSARVQVAKLEDHLEINVADDGAGFEPKQLSATEGTSGGFGLFAVRERLDLLGGTLDIQSNPGRGSRFTMVVPLTTPAQQVLPANRNPNVSVVLSPPDRIVVADGRTRVVLVDDHIVMRQGLAAILRKEPDLAIVGEASDGESAVRLILDLRPDVVLMDISLPGMDGIEATRIIHAQLPEVHIIGLSMFEQADRAEALRQAGAASYLAKSAPFETIVAAVRAWAPGRSVRP